MHKHTYRTLADISSYGSKSNPKSKNGMNDKIITNEAAQIYKEEAEALKMKLEIVRQELTDSYKSKGERTQQILDMVWFKHKIIFFYLKNPHH